MAIDVEVRNFPAALGVNAAPAAYPVLIPELIMRAITVGGPVGGSSRQRSWRRKAIGTLVRSAVAEGDHLAPAPALVPTGLYETTEPTEMGAISFRLGMALAAVVASRILGVNKTLHLPGTTSRGDLYGKDQLAQYHVIEAKGRTSKTQPALVAAAKAQALALGPPDGQAPATASASVADLSRRPFYVLLDDPPEEPPFRRPASMTDDEFIGEYYSPVSDLLEEQTPEPSGEPEIDQWASGAWLPGRGIWLGRSKRMNESVDHELSADDLPPYDPRTAFVADDGFALVLDESFR